MASKPKTDDTAAPDAAEVAPQAAPAADQAQPAADAAQTSESAPAAPGDAADPAPVPPASGLAYLDHDDPNASATVHGVEIVRGVEGFFLVPLHFVENLVSHGFRLVSEAIAKIEGN